VSIVAGRVFCSEDEAVRRGFGGAACARRRAILRETISAFEQAEPHDFYHRLAKANLDRWRSEVRVERAGCDVDVLPGDWGDVTQSLTRRYGACFAVLNMASPHVPGGAYVEGGIAQEENMFRRTDCHFRVRDDDYDVDSDRYRPAMARRLSAGGGRVYLDAACARVCIRGREDQSRADLGYAWLPHEQVFPFLELRAAAQDLRDGSTFDTNECRRRVAAQFDTLQERGIRHVMLGAFGCGAFRNPAEHVARVYREEIAKRMSDFAVIAFAVFSAGYGPDNYRPFKEAIADG
jgi:hypothetical protein